LSRWLPALRAAGGGIAEAVSKRVEKIIDGAAFNKDSLALAYDWLVAPTYRLSAPAKNIAQ